MHITNNIILHLHVILLKLPGMYTYTVQINNV